MGQRRSAALHMRTYICIANSLYFNCTLTHRHMLVSHFGFVWIMTVAETYNCTLLFWLLILAVCMVMGFGSSYLALLFIVCPLLGRSVARAIPSLFSARKEKTEGLLDTRRSAASTSAAPANVAVAGGWFFLFCHLLATSIPTTLWVQVVYYVLMLFTPLMGRSGGVVPPDVLIGALVGVSVSVGGMGVVSVVAQLEAVEGEEDKGKKPSSSAGLLSASTSSAAASASPLQQQLTTRSVFRFVLLTCALLALLLTTGLLPAHSANSRQKSSGAGLSAAYGPLTPKRTYFQHISRVWYAPVSLSALQQQQTTAESGAGKKQKRELLVAHSTATQTGGASESGGWEVTRSDSGVWVNSMDYNGNEPVRAVHHFQTPEWRYVLCVLCSVCVLRLLTSL
jgi:hypothetical protein